MVNYNGCPYCKPNNEDRVESIDSLTDFSSEVEIEGLHIRKRYDDKFSKHGSPSNVNVKFIARLKLIYIGEKLCTWQTSMSYNN